ncbi:MAG TPA: hypothetical protein VLA23_09315, partial [Candidatus Limnocylindrales bacterium]|nr:hypothetical protein [Candidatus Limnocylindrales bacterium]
MNDLLLPLVAAGAAALSILLIVVGLTSRRSVDPVQARLTQLGAAQAKNLEELELQQPFFDRTMRPLVSRIAASSTRLSSANFSERTEKRLALAGNPNDLRVPDWLGIKVVAAVVGAVLFFLLFTFLLGVGIPLNFALA